MLVIYRQPEADGPAMDYMLVERRLKFNISPVRDDI